MNRLPRQYYRPAMAAVTALFLFVTLALAAIDQGREAPERDRKNRFCISCHEMKNTVYQEYKNTIHFKNASGMRASCADCHVPESFIPGMIRKAQAGRELLAKIQGTINTPEKFEDRRLLLANRVWADMEKNNSAECQTCHLTSGFEYKAFKNPDGAKRMEKGLAEGQTCINCHKGIAHQMPDVSLGYKAKFKDLSALSAKEKRKKNQTPHTLSTLPLYLAPRDTKKAGKLLPATQLKILKVKKGRVQVRVDGWQQDGVKAMIYAEQGKRIFSAALSKRAYDRVKTEKTLFDPDTDLTWHQVSFVCWIDNAGLVSDKEKLWEYGSEMHSASCSPCHSATPANHFLANQWMGSLKSMSRNTNLDKEEYRFLLKYLQFHARDTGGGVH